MDNQVVILKFENGATASFTCVAFSKDVGQRRTTVFGHLGELQGDGENQIVHFDFLTGKSTVYYPEYECQLPSSMLGGHGGGDFYLIHNFIQAVASQDQSKIFSSVREALESHLVVFQPEQSIKQKIVLHPQPNSLAW